MLQKDYLETQLWLTYLCEIGRAREQIKTRIHTDLP